MKSRAVTSSGTTNSQSAANFIAEGVAARTEPWHLVALIGIISLAAGLRFFRLDQQGYGNLYYAAGVWSMLQSWHSFFFVAFDPQGFLAIDKPPLGLWAQAASVMLFGWRGWSLLLPQALAGTFSVGALFLLVRRNFGLNAGLLAALTLALTPIAVATDRNNTMDSLLVLVLLLAALCIQAAATSGKLPMLLLGAGLVGVGFNIKMLQAFLPLPALCLWYLAAAPQEWRRRVVQLVLALGVVGLVSLPWIVAVDLTSASARPFIASSSNSELDLVLGHNGGARLMENPLHRPTPLTSYVTDEIGFPGPLRMWQQQLGGQISWLLPLALMGLFAALWPALPGNDAPGSRAALLMWGTWLVLELAFFSVGRKFHRYYLVMLGPPVAALVGVGLVALWRHYRAHGWRSWLLPIALLVTAAGQAVLLSPVAPWGRLFAALVVGASILIALTLVMMRRRGQAQWVAGVVALGVAALLSAPALWAATPLWGAHPSQPYAGLDLWAAPMDRDAPHFARLVAYLRANQADARFLVATIQAPTAAPLMLETGAAVMTLGGYSGGDTILSVEQFAAHIQANDVRFVLLPNKTDQQPELVGWVTTHCRTVPPVAWAAATEPAAASLNISGASHTLFDCKR